MDAGSERRALTHRILIDIALAACVALAPMSALAMCDVIPGVETRFRGALGSLDRPFSIPNDVGQQLTITLDSAGCDAGSTGFTDLPGGSVPEDDYFVSIVFKPPGGGNPNAVVLTTAANSTTCAARIAAGLSQLGGGAATCRTVAAGTLEFTISSPSELGLRFPDTDPELAPDGDDHTFTGPAAIAVTPVSDPVPFSLATGRCATTAGVVACIDELYAWDGTCEDAPQHRDPIFGHFTALPPANDYEALCKTAGSVCDGTAPELRLTVDADGHALIPMDWRGVLIRADGIPIARLVTGTSDFPAFSSAPTEPIEVPGESFLASYAPGGQLLPPVFAPLSEDGTTDLSLFGSVDAPIGVIRLARRAPDLSGPTPVYSQCTDFADTPCQLDSDCATGTCGAATCRGGTNDGNVCTVDADCPGGGECGPGLFDLSDRLDGDVGPILVANTPGTLDLEAEAPVPLEGLVESNDMFAFVQLESIGGTTAGGAGELTPLDLNGDTDTYDSVVILRDRETGIAQVIGEDFGGGPAVGRAVARLRDTFYATAALTAEDDIVAFLEPEPQQGDCNSDLDICDHNDDGDVFDTILRVYQLGAPDPITIGLDEAVDAEEILDGRALRLSDGLVFYRQNEWARAQQTTTLVNFSNLFEKRLPIPSPDGRFVVYASQAQEIPEDTNSSIFDVYVLDRDTDTDAIFDEPGATQTVVVSVDASGTVGNNHSFPGGMSSDGRYVAFCSDASNLLGTGVDTNGVMDAFVHDRDADSDGIFDEAGAIATIRVSVSAAGDEADAMSCYNQQFPRMSADGRYVVFNSEATNLVPGDLNGTGLGSDDVYIHDRDADGDGIYDEVGATAVIRVNNAPTKRTLHPAISSDGRFVAFVGDVASGDHIVVYDRDTDGNGVYDETGMTSYSVVDVSNEGALGTSSSVLPAISDDGRFVTFVSFSDDLVPGDTNNGSDVFLHDRDTDEDGIFDEAGAIQTFALTLRADGAIGSGGFNGSGPAISRDGRYVTFHALGADGIAPEEPSTCFSGGGACTQTFRFDRIPRMAELVSRTDAGVSNGYNSGYAHLSEGGRYATFTGTALTPGATNGAYHRGPDPTDLASDLTGDSDLADTVLRVLDARAASPAPVTLGPAGQSSVAGGSAAYLSPESALGADLNGDGDTSDSVLHLYRNRAGAPVNLARAAAQVSLSERFVAARVWEGQSGTTGDLNGDGDTSDTVVQLNPTPTATSATWTDLGVAAVDVAVVDTDGGPPSTVAFRTPECDEGGGVTTGCPGGGTDLNGDGDAADAVLQVYRPDQGLPGGLISTGFAADDFVLGERVLAFRVPECGTGGPVTTVEPTTTEINTSTEGVGRDEPLDGAFDSIVSPGLLRSENRPANMPAFEERSALEFDLTSIGPTPVTSATLSLNSNGFGGSGNTLTVYGYTGDGSLALTDLEETGQIVDELILQGDSTFRNTLLNNIDVTSFVNQLLGDSADYAGFNLAISASALQGYFDSSVPSVAPKLILASGSVSAPCPDGGTDLNGDGDAGDSVLHVLDLASNEVFNTGQAAIPCPAEACDPTTPYRVAGDIVTFVTLESQQGDTDLNGDGDARDLIVQFFNASEALAESQAAAFQGPAAASAFAPAAATASTATLASACVTTVSDVSTGICSDNGEACSSDSNCAGSCYLPPGLCVENLGTACTGACPSGQFCREGTCHVEGGSSCANDSQCVAPEFCIDASEIGIPLTSPIEPRITGQSLFASSGLSETDLGGAVCTSDADCAGGEVCGEAGRCQADRSDLRVAAAADEDKDGVPDPFDNCPRRANTNQADLDGDAAGDACDLDADGDTVLDDVDNCLAQPNPDQLDTDGDGDGNDCDADDDNDGILDVHETNTGVYVSPTDTGSDPLNPDTDGDGLDDGTEVANGTDPNTPDPVPGVPALSLGAWFALIGVFLITGLSALSIRRSDSKSTSPRARSPR